MAWTVLTAGLIYFVQWNTTSDIEAFKEQSRLVYLSARIHRLGLEKIMHTRTYLLLGAATDRTRADEIDLQLKQDIQSLLVAAMKDEQIASLIKSAMDLERIHEDSRKGLIWNKPASVRASSNELKVFVNEVSPKWDRFSEKLFEIHAGLQNRLDAGMTRLNRNQEFNSVLVQTILFASSVFVLLAGLMGFSDRKSLHRKMKEESHQFRLFTEYNQEIFWVFSIVEQKMLYVSPAFQKIWGISAEDIYIDPRICLGSIHPDDRDAVVDCWKKNLAKGTPYDIEFRIVGKDGVKWLSDRSVRFFEPDKTVSRLFGITTDVTEKKAKELELLQAQDKIIQYEKMRSLGRLAGGIAHEFNNILNAMLGYAGLLKTQLAADPTASRRLSIIEESGRRGAGLTRKLLDYSRQRSLNMKEVDLRESLEQSLELTKSFVVPEIAVECSMPSERLGVLGDSNLLVQAFLNLILNSYDSMPNGGKLTITAYRAGESEIKVEIKDTGTGIPESILGQVFEPFFTTKPEGQGTGLGLSIVFSTIRSHKGEITVDSKEGYGTTFVIVFPVSAFKPAVRDLSLAGYDWIDDDLPPQTLVLENDGRKQIELLRFTRENPGSFKILSNIGEVEEVLRGSDEAQTLLVGSALTEEEKGRLFKLRQIGKLTVRYLSPPQA